MKIYVFRVSCFHLGTPRKSTCTWSCGWEKFPCTLHRHRRSTISRTRPRGTRQKSSNVTFFTSWTLLHSPPPLAFNCPLHSQLFGWPAECVYSQLRGAFKSNFWNCLGFCRNQVDPPPPPPPRKLGHPKLKKKCILGYSKHIIFMKKSNFLVIFYVIFGDF